MTDLPTGLYELLHTYELHERLTRAGLLERAIWKNLPPEELHKHIAIPLAREIALFIGEVIEGKEDDDWAASLENALSSPAALSSIIQALRPVDSEILQQVIPNPPLAARTTRPDTPLCASALLTGSSRSPALRTQLIKELATCDRADWLVSFIKYAGILPLLPALRDFTQTPGANGVPRLRIATTSYMGATDSKAIKALLELPNTEVRVSYDTKRTRLHAKAYLFHRATGFGSAYIGSANVSKAALDEGLEWTAKVSQYETEHLWKHAIATFESHWEDETEFSPCQLGDLSTLEKALDQERGSPANDDPLTFFDLRPYGYQQVILDDIIAERGAGKRRHLVIAATGTGKTMIAAFDYKAFALENGGTPRLLFVAHREEILKQARSAFRQIMRNGSFGDLVFGGAQLTQTDHLFCTVQSWNSREFYAFEPSHFDYVVLDEAHHASADTYQRLIGHLQPLSLLGLTATPERSDGNDIRDDFGGAFTHEIRLPEAVERALLSPFHYFGIPDLDGLDFSSVAWKRGGYDVSQLRGQLEGNLARAQWVMSQTENHVANIGATRGLGFCVSVAHADFMAAFCNEHGIPAIALSAESPKHIRMQAQQRLRSCEINFIFTVDLYNEGVDIPSVNTVLFLRPTESLTLFLQQLGRGLRLHEDKSHLTVLDFIAPQNQNFSFAKRFRALSSRPELRIDKQIESDMPYIPAGCLIHLEKQAKEHVLNNIRSATNTLRGQRLLQELRLLKAQMPGAVRLQDMMNFLHLDTPDLIYRRGLPHALLAHASGTPIDDGLTKQNIAMAKGFRRLALMDDTHLIQSARDLLTKDSGAPALVHALVHSVLWSKDKPGDGTLEDAQQFLASRKGLANDLAELLEWLLSHRTPTSINRFPNQTGPLSLHASYTREQVLLALGLGTFENPRSFREGVLHVPERKIDVFFADVDKSEADFAPTTMYDDYAITDRLFHWQSQSQTADTTEVGQRYIRHKEMGYTPMLFIRQRKKLANGLTSPFLFAGPLQYHKHEGSKPISFIWALEHPIPAKAMSWARRIG